MLSRAHTTLLPLLCGLATLLLVASAFPLTSHVTHGVPPAPAAAFSLDLPSSIVQARPAPPQAIARKQEMPSLPPFLEVFRNAKKTAVVATRVEWVTAVGPAAGYLARSEAVGRLPALLLIPGEPGWSEWIKLSARELAGIGYVVLAVELDAESLRGGHGEPFAEQTVERTLARLTAAVRWLHRREDVFPERVGVVGWSAGGTWALALASAAALEACVACDGPMTVDPALLAGLRYTSLLGIWSGAQAGRLGRDELAGFHRTLAQAGIENRLLVFDKARGGFMDSGQRDTYRFEDAERAWFEIYEFLGEHVEDAPLKGRDRAGGQKNSDKSPPLDAEGRLPPPARNAATIADLMRSANAPAGVRGALAQQLNDEPADEKAWQQVRARAALLAEVGNLLLERDPPRGRRPSWQKRATAYRDAALAIAAAADHHDFSAASEALRELNRSCSACHVEHR